MNLEVCKKCRRCGFHLCTNGSMYSRKLEYYLEVTYRKNGVQKILVEINKKEIMKKFSDKLQDFYFDSLYFKCSINKDSNELKQDDEYLIKIMDFLKEESQVPCPYEFEHKIV
jgi:hypothetical protein